MPERIAFSDIVCAATQSFITSEKSHVQVAAATRGCKWFYSLRAVGTTLSEVHALHRVPF